MRTDATLSALVAALTANCGDVFEACRAAGVSPLFVARWRKDDAKVNEQIEEAARVGIMQIESAALKRAVHGVAEDVWFKGEVVGEKLVYSDGLLQTMLKGRLAHVYGSDATGGNVFNGPVQINNMPRANSYAEWLEMKDATDTRRALPAPVQDSSVVIDQVSDALAGTDFGVVRSPQLAGLGL